MEALFYAKVFKKPVVATYHTFLPGFIKHFKISMLSELELVKNVLDMYTKLIYSTANAVITPSNSMKKMLIKNGVSWVGIRLIGIRILYSHRYDSHSPMVLREYYPFYPNGALTSHIQA